MAKLFRRSRSTAARVTHSPNVSSSSHVPVGHFPVHVVGSDHQTSEKRFVVNAELLRHPIFSELLDRSAQEYGYHQRGVLRIPIDIAVFERVLECLRLGRDPSTLVRILCLGLSSSSIY